VSGDTGISTAIPRDAGGALRAGQRLMGHPKVPARSISIEGFFKAIPDFQTQRKPQKS